MPARPRDHDPGGAASRRADRPAVLITRAAAQAAPLAAALAAHGLRGLACPVLRIEAAATPDDLPDLDRYRWLVFTSPNAVTHLAELARARGLVPLPPECLLAAVGPGTAAALADLGRPPDLVPDASTGEALIAAFATVELPPGTRVLRLRGDRAPGVVEQALTGLGADVDALTVYRTLVVSPPPEAAAAIREGAVAAVTFASPSAVHGLDGGLPGHRLHARVPAVCIGPVTARAAAAAGWRRVITAATATPADLAGAVMAALEA